MAIYAWRLWYVYEIGGIRIQPEYVAPGRRSYVKPALYGFNYVQWPINQAFHAKCKLSECCSECNTEFSYENKGVIPDVNCTCGIYAVKHPNDLIQHANTHVLGVVELWGKIITAEYGYRAQTAQLRALIDVSDSIATTYRVPSLPTIDYAEKEYFS